MRRTVSPAKERAPAVETRSMADLNEWKYIGHFSSYCIYAKDDIRRLIDTITGRVITQYKFKEAREGDIDARL